MFYIYSRSQFERETMLSAEGLSLPALWWARALAIFGKMLWGQVPSVLKFLAFHTRWPWQMQFMAGLTWWLWVCPYCRQLWVCWAGDSLCLSFHLPPSPNNCSGLQQGLQCGLPKLLRACHLVWEYYSCCCICLAAGLCSNWIKANTWVPHCNPTAS